MPSEVPLQTGVEVAFTSDFKRNVRQLAKKYRRIKPDLQPVVERIERGETPGDRVPRTGTERVIFKARIRNSDSAKSKSGGYRMIYWVESSRSVVLITIYSKTEQGDVAAEYIRRVIAEHDRQQA